MTTPPFENKFSRLARMLTLPSRKQRLSPPKRDESLNLPRYHSHSDTCLASLCTLPSDNVDETLSLTQSKVHLRFFRNKAPRGVPQSHLSSRTGRRLSERLTACTGPHPCKFHIHFTISKIWNLSRVFALKYLFKSQG